ncbi:MAG: DUF1330 domain-containing protein [Ahrensia sp.]
MPKAYWIARIDVTQPERYSEYVEAASPAYKEFGAKFIVRGGAIGGGEGENRGRNVVIEFASMDDALGCYNCDQYAKARAIRQEISVGELVIVEGFDG